MQAASPPERSLTAYTLDEQPDPNRERRTYRLLKRPPASSTKSGRTAALSGATGCSEAPCIPPGQQVGLENGKGGVRQHATTAGLTCGALAWDGPRDVWVPAQEDQQLFAALHHLCIKEGV